MADQPVAAGAVADGAVDDTGPTDQSDADGTDEPVGDPQDIDAAVADEAPSEDMTGDELPAVDDSTSDASTDIHASADTDPGTDADLAAGTGADLATEADAGTGADSVPDDVADAGTDAESAPTDAPPAETSDAPPAPTTPNATEPPTAPVSTAAAPEPPSAPVATSAASGTPATTEPTAGTAAPATTTPTTPEGPAGQPGGRDDATAVIAPVVAAAPSAPAPTPPPPVGTLATPVTRTVPGPASTAVAPTSAGPVTPSVTAAAGAAAAAAATGAAGTSKAEAAPAVAAAPVASATTRQQPQTPVQPQPPIASGPVPPAERAESPLDVFEAEDGKRRWPKRLLIVAGIVVALGAAYVGASYALADTVPRGATVAGVDIGGLSSDEAVARLDTELADATTQPIEVVANDVQATVDPVAAGLAFDSQATVDELTGVDLADPARLWAHLAGVGPQDPVTSVDDEALSAAIGDLGTSLALAPVDGTVVFVDATPQSTAAVDGWNLDQAGATDVLAADWLVAARPIELPTATVAPDITQEETDAALVEARQVTSAPVTVSAEGRTALLDAATLAANSSFVPVDGSLVLQMNGEGLTEVVLAQLPDLLTQSADAHFEFVNDAPVIVPGIPGTSLDPAAVATSVATATAAADRTAPVELVQADPSESTAELEALGVKEIVSEFSTPLNSEPRRTVNITNGASKISGTLIRPGETFSLTEALGPIDAAHGYVEAGAIVSGEHTDAWGGGLSQVSTTTYNAAFLAGFEDVEHRPHSEWFSRYPEGREATIFTGTLDMRWKNNTPHGALVQAWVSGGRVYVRVWGTKYWTVESITSPRSGVVSPTTVYSQSPTCEPQSAGNPGFSVTVTRKTYLNGALEKTESNSWRYKPQNKVICGAPPAATPPPATP
ncbi:VanW family protein [Cellulomonas sp. Leaf334]|uniref:VanW family protein n=1 Tax=Cellulomonas sp. Leaf334 TaxID=1736339 RepID=UPI0006F4D2D3|nr:VanW family protein [Cellulomonas sp. Leaf334]KQR12305.1 hypothetical protein ASF78_14285 [Cellulomonas sp. Leaf334]